MSELLDKLEPRIRQKISIIPSGCWMWLASNSLSIHGHSRSPRVVLYELVLGQTVDGFLRPFCGCDKCVNPTHMGVVSNGRYNSTPDKLWANTVRTETGCLVWAGATTRKERGYGMLSWNGERRLAHHLAYELANGSIPSGMVVMHTCDNSLCINPEHLTVGTQEDNIHDMFKKGRARIVRGPSHHKAKLTRQEQEDIARLLNNGVGTAALAAKYRVSRTTIRNIANGYRYAT